jgi:hypothetical protein
MSSDNKEDVIYTKVIFNPGSLSDDEGLDQSGELQLEDGMRIIQVNQDETLAPEKGQIKKSTTLKLLVIVNSSYRVGSIISVTVDDLM